MRPYQTRVRRMRQPGKHYGRKTDDPRQEYHDPAIRAARNAARRQRTSRQRTSRQRTNRQRRQS